MNLFIFCPRLQALLFLNRLSWSPTHPLSSKDKDNLLNVVHRRKDAILSDSPFEPIIKTEVLTEGAGKKELARLLSATDELIASTGRSE